MSEFRLKRMRHHNAIQFPKDHVEFYVPKGYLTLEMIEMYRQLMNDVRNGDLLRV